MAERFIRDTMRFAKKSIELESCLGLCQCGEKRNNVSVFGDG
jgi:hypothetical protein